VHEVSWPSEERLSLVEAQLSGLPGPCGRLLASVGAENRRRHGRTRGAIITCLPGQAGWDAGLVPHSLS
jgi:hypothetical protein